MRQIYEEFKILYNMVCNLFIYLKIKYFKQLEILIIWLCVNIYKVQHYW